MSWKDVEGTKLLEPPLSLKDCLDAIELVPGEVSHEKLQEYDDWTRKNGKEGA